MKKKVSMLLGTILITSSCIAFAGTTYDPYRTIVGKVNGSGYTAYQSKTTTGAAAKLSSDYVGVSGEDDYKVDVRQQDINGDVAD